MKAIVQHGYGPPEQVLKLEEIERPEPGDDDVLIRVRASSVNTPDWIVTAGIPYILRLGNGLRGPKTRVRGSDLAGVVEAVGKGVTGFQPGDEVFGSAWSVKLGQGAGAFAEYALAPKHQLLRKPAELTFEDAAASVMSGITALVAIRDVGKVGPGTRVLINGASGGVGTLAVQIAKHYGAEVTGVCGPKNLERVRSLGADHVIDYTREDFTRGEARYDVVLDNVMNRWASASARVLTPTGRVLPNSVGKGRWFGALLRMGAAIFAARWSDRTRIVDCRVNADNLEALAALLVSGKVKVVVDRTYPLADTGRAVAHMQGGHASGKIVITV